MQILERRWTQMSIRPSVDAASRLRADRQDDQGGPVLSVQAFGGGWAQAHSVRHRRDLNYAEYYADWRPKDSVGCMSPRDVLAEHRPMRRMNTAVSRRSRSTRCLPDGGLEDPDSGPKMVPTVVT